MTDQPRGRWKASGKDIHFLDGEWVGLHNQTLAHAIAARHNAILQDFASALDTAMAEIDQWHATGSDAARALVLLENRALQLESQLGEAHAEIARLEAQLSEAHELFPAPPRFPRPIGLAKRTTGGDDGL